MDATSRKPGAIAKELGVTGMTLRNYVKQFAPFLSEQATNETNRRFTPEDVRTLRLVRQLLDEGNTYEQVRQLLPERLPVTGEILDAEPEPEPEPVTGTPSSIAPMEFFTQFIDALKEEHRTTNQAKDEHLETLKAENARLQAEIEYLRLPFFVKWFRKPRAE